MINKQKLIAWIEYNKDKIILESSLMDSKEKAASYALDVIMEWVEILSNREKSKE